MIDDVQKASIEEAEYYVVVKDAIRMSKRHFESGFCAGILIGLFVGVTFTIWALAHGNH